MNNHGINSAALNGSAVRMIAGAALLAVVMTASANPTRTQFATAQPVLSAKVVANALRVANARARVTITSDGSAQWVIATSAAVSITVTSTARATYTAAWSAARISAKVAGFITRPGEAMARSAISLTADPTVTLGYSSDIRVTSWASADPSVQRLGEPTWSRDGYARIESAVTVTATADRTARDLVPLRWVRSGAWSDGPRRRPASCCSTPVSPCCTNRA